MNIISLSKHLIFAVVFIGAYVSANAQVLYVGPDQIPIQETGFGYSSSYKVLRLGLDQNNRALALGVDPSTVTGGNFSGSGQILLGNKGILAPNAAGNDWMGVLRATQGKVYVGGSLSSGEVAGDGLVVSGGNVGIGTSSPSGLVDIWNPYSSGTDSLRFSYYDGSSYWMGIQPYVVGAGNVGYKFRTHNVSITVDAFAITGAGNVGIGTTTPFHKLSVNGTIRAKEVIVDTGWADYVFADDYELMPLVDVAASIEAHGHLPGVPSAAQVQANGISVGAMQALLLAKIEELTLHQIAQDERIRALETENGVLRQKP